MTNTSYKYLFGPVPSRRLGRSLGVDIVPFKTCTQNCIYCQLGKDAPQSIERKEYVPIDAVLDELKRKIADGLKADFITISGSGEPTLNSQLGTLIDGIRQLTDIPVTVITNGTLLSEPDVRDNCAKADIVLPSLDAGDPETFERMNHPHQLIAFDQFVDGLCQFRKEYDGQIWLEVFFCDTINTDPDSVTNIRNLIDHISPDKVQINTSVRPTTHDGAIRVGPEKLQKIATALGNSVEVIADFSKQTDAAPLANEKQAILDMLCRRPCSLENICSGLGMHPAAALKAVQQLLDGSQIKAEQKNQHTFYKIR